jgi:hypothetical protein
MNRVYPRDDSEPVDVVCHENLARLERVELVPTVTLALLALWRSPALT